LFCFLRTGIVPASFRPDSHPKGVTQNQKCRGFFASLLPLPGAAERRATRCDGATYRRPMVSSMEQSWMSSEPFTPSVKPSILMSRAVILDESTPVTVRMRPSVADTPAAAVRSCLMSVHSSCGGGRKRQRRGRTTRREVPRAEREVQELGGREALGVWWALRLLLLLGETVSLNRGVTQPSHRALTLTRLVVRCSSTGTPPRNTRRHCWCSAAQARGHQREPAPSTLS
jgi:hypothetical protein